MTRRTDRPATVAAPWWPATAPDRPGQVGATAVLATICVAAIIGGLAAVSAPLALAAAIAVALFAAVAVHPPMALYAYLAITPLVAGIERGALIPVLRPNEALLLLVASAAAARLALCRASGRPLGRPLDAVDTSLVAMAVAGSLLPLLWLIARGSTVTLDDVLFATTLWKLVLLYWLARVAVRGNAQVRICLVVALAAFAIVAVVAILQSRQLLGVPELLAPLHAPLDDEEALRIGRGTSTLGSSHAVADVMLLSLMVVAAWLLRGARPRWLLGAAAALFTFGVFASGQFSGVIGLVVAVAALGWVTGRLRRIVTLAVPLSVVAAVGLWPVVTRRLEGFGGARIPQSWVGRWENLTEVVWPELFSDPWHLAFGVRPATRVPAPEWWRDWIWIESGHTWFLWNGGIPLLAAFVVFLWAAMRATARVARLRDDAVGVAAVAAFAGVCAVAVLSILDQHLTLRGTADFLVPLLALALTRESDTPAETLAHTHGETS